MCLLNISNIKKKEKDNKIYAFLFFLIFFIATSLPAVAVNKMDSKDIKELKKLGFNMTGQTNSTSSMTDIVDIKDLEKIKLKFDYKKALLIVLILILLLVASFLAYHLYKKKKKNDEGKSEKLAIDPYKLAGKKLDILKIKEITTKQFYFELSYILREFIDNVFNINASEMTKEELIHAFKEIDIKINLKDDLRNFLTKSDLIKFAKFKTEAEKRKDFDFVSSFISEYKKIKENMDEEQCL